MGPIFIVPPVWSVFDRNGVTNAVDIEEVGGFQSVTKRACYALKKRKKPNNDGVCYGVSGKDAVGGGKKGKGTWTADGTG